MTKLTFEQQQDLNHIRDLAMRMACDGLTTAELRCLNPNLLRAAPEMYETLKELMFQFAAAVERPYSADARVYKQAEEAIAKAEGK